MTNLARLTPHILNQIQIPKWERKAQLLGLVATRTETPDSWTELGMRELTELGRSHEEACWDRAVLQELADRHRVLSRMKAAGSHHGDLYRIRGDRLSQLEGWRHVPWSSSARNAVRVLRAIEAGVGPEPWRVDVPGSAETSGVGPSDQETCDNKSPGQLPKSPHMAPEEPHMAPENEALTSTPTPHGSGEPSPSTQCLWRSKDLPLSLGSEGGREEVLNRAYRPVLGALQATLGRPCIGRQADRLRVVVAANLDHHDQLVEHIVRTFAGMYSVRAAIDQLEQWTPTTVAGKDWTVECQVLERRIRQLEAGAPDDEHLPELHQQLAEAQARRDA